MGCARDIVECAGVPRFWFSDFPLGHSAGKPFDPVSQRQTLVGALSVFESATVPGTTVVSPQVWSRDESWKEDFMNVAMLSEAQIAKLRSTHEHTRALKKQNAGPD